MFWICGQRNPAAFTLIEKLQRLPKNLHESHSSTSAMAARTHVPPIWLRHRGRLIMSATESHLHSRARRPCKYSLLYHSWIWQANQSIQLWCCRSDTHKQGCGCALFVYLITKAACNACWRQKQVVCSKHWQKRKQWKLCNIHRTKLMTGPCWGQPNIHGETNPLPFRTVDWFPRKARF